MFCIDLWVILDELCGSYSCILYELYVSVVCGLVVLDEVCTPFVITLPPIIRHPPRHPIPTPIDPLSSLYRRSSTLYSLVFIFNLHSLLPRVIAHIHSILYSAFSILYSPLSIQYSPQYYIHTDMGLGIPTWTCWSPLDVCTMRVRVWRRWWL